MTIDQKTRNEHIAILKKFSKKPKTVENLCFSNSKNVTEYKILMYNYLSEKNINIKSLFNSDFYSDCKEKYNEIDEFIEHPFNLAEGIAKCRCGNEKIFTFSKQTRSGDEATTVFCFCIECKNRWTLN